jgi:LAS superfamily LD-carboxypeptidase LdcB
MIRVIALIIFFTVTTLNLFNSIDLPQNEDLSNNDTAINGVIDIEQESNTEELEPKKVITSTPLNTTSTTDSWWEYPSNIKSTTRSGDDLLVLVNKEYRLPSTYAPTDLVKVGESVIRRGSNYSLRSVVIAPLTKLVSAAKSDGIDLSIVSAYRSYSTQQSTYQYWVNYNNGCVSCADRISARAGHS